MTAVTVTARMTADEFLGMPRDETGRRYQSIDGELVVNEPTWMHSCSQGHGPVRAAFAVDLAP